MAKKILTDINLNQLEVQNATIQNLASDPSNPVKGQVYFNTTTNKFRCYNGSSWDEMGSSSGSVTSVGVANDTNGGLSVTGSPITSSGTIKVGHSNVLSNAQTASGVYPIKIDKNGHISEYGTAVDFSTYAPVNSPALTGTPTAPTANAGTNTTQIATTAFVSNAISSISGGMTYKGTVGTGGTVESLPTSNVKVGDTYKVITDGTYASQSAKVGDMFIATATTPTWSYIPSGDDAAVTQITAGAGLNTTSDNTGTDGGTITTTGTLYLTKSGVTAGTYNNVVVDKYGRVTSGSNVTIPTKTSDLQNTSAFVAYDPNTITGNGSKTSFDIDTDGVPYIVQVFDYDTKEEVITDVTIGEYRVTVSFATAPASGKKYNVFIITYDA